MNIKIEKKYREDEKGNILNVEYVLWVKSSVHIYTFDEFVALKAKLMTYEIK